MANSTKSLPIHEEILLLALRDKEGTFLNASVGYAVAGGILSELALRKRIEVSNDKKQIVKLVDNSPTNDAMLDEVLQEIAECKKAKSMTHWIGHVVIKPRLQHCVAEQLCEKKILRTEDKKILWVFNHKTYPETAAAYEREIKQRMRKLMFGQTTRHDERTTILISLAFHTDLLRANFDKDRVKLNLERIKKIAKGDMFAARATRSAVEAMQASIMMITTMSAAIHSG